MSNLAPQLIQKLWNYCNILRDDGLSYANYLEFAADFRNPKALELPGI